MADQPKRLAQWDDCRDDHHTWGVQYFKTQDDEKQRGFGAPSHHRTFDVPDPMITNELKDRVNRLLDTSGRRYGRLKQDAKKEYASDI